MHLFIKNMVCSRCILAVTKELDNLGIGALSVGMGEVTLSERPAEKQLASLEERLKELGFE
jgi:hypothetical protein